jgi:hypothetical protein
MTIYNVRNNSHVYNNIACYFFYLKSRDQIKNRYKTITKILSRVVVAVMLQAFIQVLGSNLFWTPTILTGFPKSSQEKFGNILQFRYDCFISKIFKFFFHQASHISTLYFPDIKITVKQIKIADKITDNNLFINAI